MNIHAILLSVTYTRKSRCRAVGTVQRDIVLRGSLRLPKYPDRFLDDRLLFPSLPSARIPDKFCALEKGKRDFGMRT